VRFVDTSFWIGLRFARDGRHPQAKALWESGPGALVTTSLVLSETWTFLSRRAGHSRALEFYDAASKLPNMSIRPIDDEIESEAWNWLRRHDERPYSFVDATSFAVMRRMRIREALAFDGDFAAAGFAEARA